MTHYYDCTYMQYIMIVHTYYTYTFHGECTHIQYIMVIVLTQLKPPITPSKTQVNAANTPNGVSDEDIKDTEVCTVLPTYK